VLGTCFSCHNGTTARGKGTNHIPSANTCETCHVTTAWTPARFDHVGVTPGTCSSCHNGVRASGKSTTHLPTTAECDSCHTTLAWRPARFSHAGITSGCGGCHNGTTATGKDPGHMTTARECNVCHSTTAWTPLTHRHSTANYPGDHRVALTCLSCHTSNADTIPWRTPAYANSCAGCHSGNYRSGPHTKYDTPKTLYTVSELRNCSGACHVYTNSTLTTISRRRNGPQHTVSKNSFD
jgi:hypothetical protein